MSKPTPLHAALLALGVACAAVLLWLWRQPRAISTSMVPSPKTDNRGVTSAIQSVPMPAAKTPTLADLLPELRAAWALLERTLARRDVRENEAVLSFKDEAAMRRFLDRAQAAGLTVLGRIDALRSVRVRFNQLGALQDDLLQNASDYADAGANVLVGIPHPPAREDRLAVNQVPFGNETLAFLGATGDRSTWGRGVTVAVLDTGVAADATFGAGRLQTLDIGLGITPGTNAKEDGHATAVAALAAGSSPDAAGVAPAANVLSIRVTDDNGLSDLFTVSRGIVAAVDGGAKVINVSLGGYSSGSVLDAAIAYANSRGVIIVAAAGNDQAAQLAWPAADTRVVSVGAVDRAEQQVSFSNSGPQLQLSAPGYGVQTAWLNGQRVYVDGTSASAPIVSGSIAALLSQNPSLTPQQAADLLGRTANDTGQPGADPAFGHGIVNLGTAMNSSNPSYVDTAISSHFYDAEHNQMQFVVQNRSGRMVTGMTLEADVAGTAMRWTVPPLSAGETFIARAPADAIALQTKGSLTFTTELKNPPGVSDQVPTNNRRSSVLSTTPKR